MKKCIYVCFHQKVSRPPTHPLLRKALKVCYDLQYKYKGCPHVKKTCFLSGIARISSPPPLPPIWATCTPFFGRQKRRFSAYYRTK